MKSYGGYTGNYQLNMPLGTGSLLATYQRDIWKGDFDVDLYNNDKYVDTINRRSNDYQNNNITFIQHLFLIWETWNY